MKVHELVALLKTTDQEAVVVIGEGSEPNLWLLGLWGVASRQLMAIRTVSARDPSPPSRSSRFYGGCPAIRIVDTAVQRESIKMHILLSRYEPSTHFQISLNFFMPSSDHLLLEGDHPSAISRATSAAKTSTVTPTKVMARNM